MIRRLLPILLLLLPLPAAAQNVVFTEDERAMISAHGPWPPERERDPSNRVSDDPRAAALGGKLFADTALSADGTVSCATCHRADATFADGRATGKGLVVVHRNTPSVINARWQRWYGWDGGADSLWAASERPILAAPEMGGDAARVKARILAELDYKAAFAALFGDPAPMAAEDVLVNAAKCIAAFQETLVSKRTPFDRFRDALEKGGDDPAYPAAARRGLKIFVGRGNCSLCHFGPMFSNGEFSDAAVPYFLPGGGVDKGRYTGIQFLRASPYNLLGRHNDDGARTSAFKTRHVTLGHRNFGEFKVPSLRGVAATAPYMHDGSLEHI